MNAAHRLLLVARAHTLIAHERRIHYAQVRPMYCQRLSWQAVLILLNAPNGRLVMDCSEAVTCLYKWCDLEDPNGLHFNGDGYTGTMLAHLPHYTDPGQARNGALVVFGPGTGEHVCMVIEPGDDPLLFSHGSERGPVAVRLSVERRYHRPPVTFLRVAEL